MKAIITLLIMAGFFTGIISQICHTGPASSAGILVLLCAASLLPHKPRRYPACTAGIQQEIWVNHLRETLYANNEFLQRSEDDSAYVNHRTVHKPQEGAAPNVVKNRTPGTGPENVNERTDTEITYQIDEYTTDPFRISHAESIELSYNKRDSILRQHRAALMEKVADNILYNWAASQATQILRTTGGDAAAHTASATGNRKLITLADIRRAARLMNSQSIPMERRCMLADADMYDQLITELISTQYRDHWQLLDSRNGIVNRIMGFDVYIRSRVLVYDNAGTPARKAPGAAGAATDNAAALFWQEDHVCRATGDIQIFEKEHDPTYYGSIYSALLRMGGSKNYTAGTGIISLVQAAGS